MAEAAATKEAKTMTMRAYDATVSPAGPLPRRLIVDRRKGEA